MNKRDLIDAISARMGDKKTATEAVNAVLDTIQAAVAKGDKVAITGFGVFEKADRPARTARNPATGATIKVPKSSVPKFRAGRGLQGDRQRREEGLTRRRADKQGQEAGRPRSGRNAAAAPMPPAGWPVPALQRHG